MPAECATRLIGLAMEEVPFEICGLILENWDYVQITNMAADLDKFYMHEGELVDAYQTHGNAVIGVYHSHPRGNRQASDVDIAYAPQHGRYWIVTPTEVVEWDMNYDVPRELGCTKGLAYAVPADCAAIRGGDQEVTGENGNRRSF